MFKVNSKSTSIRCGISWVDVVRLLLTWNILDILVYCFCCWLTGSKYRLPQQHSGTLIDMANSWSIKATLLLPYKQWPVQSNYQNTKTWCKICPKQTIKTSERRQRSGHAWWVLVHFVDSWWFFLVLDGFG